METTNTGSKVTRPLHLGCGGCIEESRSLYRSLHSRMKQLQGPRWINSFSPRVCSNCLESRLKTSLRVCMKSGNSAYQELLTSAKLQSLPFVFLVHNYDTRLSEKLLYSVDLPVPLTHSPAGTIARSSHFNFYGCTYVSYQCYLQKYVNPMWRAYQHPTT